MNRIGDIVGGCASLAALLEVSAYPKPGNVHRLRDFPGTRYEHFLAGCVSLAPWMGALAAEGARVRDAGGDLGEVGLGAHILGAAEDMLRWQSGGNVHLGVILLFAPLAAAAGATAVDGFIEPAGLRGALKDVIDAATPADTVDIYKAIGLAMSRENLGRVDELDVADPSSLRRITEEGVRPLDVFEASRSRDSISSEWATGFSVTFTEGYPYLKEQLRGGDVNESTVNTFLRVLSLHPDSLIRRKRGDEAAWAVSEKARRVLDHGGASTVRGMSMLRELDEELSAEKGGLNPGTSADLTAASLYVLLLSGWRP
ncbi:MAG TPA: triphosphoribosyl-dephospho-CoA synthase [Candidatus Bathyarchaeia archaeon]